MDLDSVLTGLKENKLREIRLSAQFVGADGIKKLTKVLLLQKDCPVTLIELYNNNLGDDGIKILADTLVLLPKLVTLDLSKNNITDEGIKRLCKVLPHMKQIVSVDLSRNIIGEEGANNLNNAIANLDNITNLDLRNSAFPFSNKGKMTDVTLKKIDTKLKTNIAAKKELSPKPNLKFISTKRQSLTDDIEAEQKKQLEEAERKKDLDVLTRKQQEETAAAATAAAAAERQRLVDLELEAAALKQRQEQEAAENARLEEERRAREVERRRAQEEEEMRAREEAERRVREEEEMRAREEAERRRAQEIEERRAREEAERRAQAEAEMRAQQEREEANRRKVEEERRVAQQIEQERKRHEELAKQAEEERKRQAVLEAELLNQNQSDDGKLSNGSESDPRRWTVAQVAAWITQIDFKQYSALFSSNYIDGELLVGLKEDDLADFPIENKIHRKRIIREVAKLITERRSPSRSGFDPELDPNSARAKAREMAAIIKTNANQLQSLVSGLEHEKYLLKQQLKDTTDKYEKQVAGLRAQLVALQLKYDKEIQQKP